MALDFTVFDRVFNAVDAAGQAMALNFASGAGLEYTREILLMAVGIEILTALIILLADSGRAAFQRLMEGMIPAAIIAGLIFNWSTMVVPAPIAISDELVTISSGGMAPAGLGSQIAEKFSPVILNLTKNILPSQQQVPTTQVPGQPAPAKSSQTLWDKFGSWWDSDPISGIFIGIADGLSSTAVALIDVALVIAAFAICWMSVLAANILIYVGLCFGPIILALSIIGKLRGLMANWISFMVGAIFFKPVLAFLISLILLMLDVVNNIAQTTPSTTMPTTAIMIFIGMFTLSMITLLVNAKSITQALFGGLAASLTPKPSSVVNLTQLSTKTK